MKVAGYLFGTVVLATIIVYQLMTGWTQVRSGKKVLFPSHTGRVKNTLIWAVKIVDKTDVKDHVNKIASDLGLINEGQIGHLDNVYLFHYDAKNLYMNKSGVNSVNVNKTKVGNVLKLNETLFSAAEMEKIIEEVEVKLESHDDVEWHSHQKIVARSKRSLQFGDPYYNRQWHLVSNDLKCQL